ncbi:MAG: Uma2 family endonuclease [Chloroflexaceae bacterium]|nr:Uma2 family endonuclease [Chloroflexaceae bacterium]
MSTDTVPVLSDDPTQLFPPGFALPDHLSLPETDGKPVQNFHEHPQSMLLTDAIRPVLDQRHPDGMYAIGQDSGIYWNLEVSLGQDPVRGSIAPDWFYVPGVPPLLDGRVRRSYVFWKELASPLIVIEFVSGDGSEERDRTPGTGKFWIYEQFIRPPYYAIYEVQPGRVDVYQLEVGEYVPVPADEYGNYPITSLGAALGIWDGTYQNCDLPWLRWYDLEGKLLPTSEEQLEQERLRAEEAQERAERLAAKLRALGIDPDAE